MVAHVVLITWGYAAGRLLQTPATLWHLTLDYPGMLLAAAGTLALVMVVATSIRAARRRLRYESWHLLHLYAYLGAGLALPHQLWTGQQLVSSPARAVFWWGLWIAALASVLVWRVGLPLWRTSRHGLRVTSRGAGGPRHRLGARRRPRAAPDAGRGRAVPLLALPGPPRLDPRQPLLPLRRPRRPWPADHGQGGRRRQRRRRAPAARHPGAGRGPLRPPQPARPDPAQGRADRRRRRRHPAAGPGRGARLRPRRRRAAPAVHRPPALRRRARSSWPATAGSGRSTSPGGAARPTPGWAPASAPPTT